MIIALNNYHLHISHLMVGHGIPFLTTKMYHQVLMVSFLMGNIYQCFNHSLAMFDIDPPSIEEYLPLDEDIPMAPVIEMDDLGEVYNFGANP